MQSGNVFVRSGAWYCRYYRSDGYRPTRRLGYVRDFPTRESIEPLVQELMKRHQFAANSLGKFVDGAYLPFVRDHLRPSTYNGYRKLWDRLSRHCSQMSLRQTRTFDIQNFLDKLAKEGNYRKSTLQHAKHFLSGIFRFAIQQGIYDGINPVTESRIPLRRPPAETYAYSLEEIKWMVGVLPEPAATVILTAAFTGLRLGELKAMVWQNLEPAEPYALYSATSSIWQSHRGEPKTESSRRPVPIIPLVAEALEMHCLRSGDLQKGPIFTNDDGTPLNLNNLRYRVILPALNRCEICLKGKGRHRSAGHEFKRDESLPEWKGWHAFRRGLASNLFELGCDELTVQRILRHSTVQVTRDHYIKLRDSKVEEAINRLSMATSEMFPSPMKIKSKWIN